MVERLRSQRIREPRKCPAHPREQLRIIVRLRERARQPMPSSPDELTARPLGPFHATSRTRSFLAALDEHPLAVTQELLETPEHRSRNHPRRHFSRRSWHERRTAQRWLDPESDRLEYFSQCRPAKAWSNQESGNDAARRGRQQWDRADLRPRKQSDPQPVPSVHVMLQVEPAEMGFVGAQEGLDPAIAGCPHRTRIHEDRVALIFACEQRPGDGP